MNAPSTFHFATLAPAQSSYILEIFANLSRIDRVNINAPPTAKIFFRLFKRRNGQPLTPAIIIIWKFITY